jgi:hypothetical protein
MKSKFRGALARPTAKNRTRETAPPPNQSNTEQPTRWAVFSSRPRNFAIAYAVLILAWTFLYAALIPENFGRNVTDRGLHLT